MTQFKIYGLGNALVDTEYHVTDELIRSQGIEKGMMTLIDDERLTTLEEALSTNGDLKKQASGGSAANTLIAAANFGVNVFYSCKVASDALGDFYYNDLVASGVSTNLNSIREDGITGRCLVMITDDAERTMNTFLGITGELGPHEIDENALKASEMLYIEGYLASSDKAHEAATRAYQIAKDNDIPIALTFSDPAMVTYFKPQLKMMVGDGVDLLFCNEQEAMTWTDTSNLRLAFDQLNQTAVTWACTHGKDGVTVFDGQIETHIPGRLVTPIDTNGAGDMFAGAFLYGIHQGWDYAKAARFGIHTSAFLVTQYGPRLPLVTHANLLKEFEAMA